jgi:hypothetical protein
MSSTFKNNLTKKDAAHKLTQKHKDLVHSEGMKVSSHVQRETDDWIVNTLMIDGVDVPYKYKRKKIYKSLKGQRVNLTYYPDTESIAGFDIEVMSIVRIKVS